MRGDEPYFMKPESVERYEAMLQNGEAVYLDPVEIDDVYHYYAEQNQIDRVEELLRLGQRLHPDDPLVLQMDAEFTLNMGNTEEALEKLDKIFQEENPFHCILRSAAFAKLGRRAEALDMAEAALYDEDPKEFVAYDLALGFMNAEDYTTALRYYQRSLRHHPDDVRTLAGILFCRTQMGDYAQVMELAEHILQLDPFNFEAWMAKGNCLGEKELYAEAIDAYDYASAIAPEEPDALVMKARCLDATDQHEQAIATLQEAAQKAVGEQKSAICIIIAGLLHEQKRDEEAADAVWKSVEELPKDPVALSRAGFTFQDIGSQREAIIMLEAASQLVPDDLAVLSPLAELYGAQERFDEAASIYEHICKIAPSAGAYALWGGTMMSLNQFQKAYNLLKKANEIDELWQTYVLMTVCDAEQKQYKKMEEDFRYAYALCPDAAPQLLKGLHPEIHQQMEDKGFFEQIERERQAYIILKENILRDKAASDNSTKEDSPTDGETGEKTED